MLTTYFGYITVHREVAFDGVTTFGLPGLSTKIHVKNNCGNKKLMRKIQTFALHVMQDCNPDLKCLLWLQVAIL